MKKTLIIVALAAVLVLALGATPAFAKYAGYNSAKQYVPWSEAQILASKNADAALMTSGPHAGYATTTIKCAVCHSVHRGGSKVLTEGAVCAYCHTPAAWGGGAVAGNLISWYGGGTLGGTVPATNGGPHSSRCSNSDCHGGPHGAMASKYDGPASKLLTRSADAELEELALANGVLTTEFATYSPTTRVLATAGVCQRAGCHYNSMMGVVTSGATTVVTIGATTPAVTGHRVIAAATTNWNSLGDMGSTNTAIGQIAYAPVAYCSSCHDLADDNNGGKAAFPHAINGVVNGAVGADGTTRPAVWLTAGAYAGDTRYAVGPYDQYTGNPATVAGSAGSSIIDGVCLKCHRGSGGASGVGLTY